MAVWLRRIRSRRCAVDARDHFVGLGDRALLDRAAVQHEYAGEGVLRVENPEPDRAVGRLDDAGVADLATRLGVEGRAIEEHVDRRPRLGPSESFATPAAVRTGSRARADECQHLRTFGHDLLAAGELGRAVVVEQLPVQLHRDARPPPVGLHGVAGAGPLFLHVGGEALGVDGPAAFLRDLAGEVDREAERVVEEERFVATDVAALHDLVEHLHAARERGTEPLLLALHDPLDRLVLLGDVGVRATHDRHGRVDERRGDEVGDAEQVGVTHRPSDDPAQHVAAFLVRGHDAVADDHRHRAAVLGEDAQADVAIGTGEGPVGDPGDLLRGCDERPHHVGVPHRLGALEDGETALEPGAGVDARGGQGHELAVGPLVELHEHEVPDLDEPVLVDRRTTAGPVGGAEVPEDLGVRAARTGVGHAPEVGVVAQALDPLGRETDGVTPDLGRFVVVLVDRDPEAVGVETEDRGDELPRPRDRFGLEVVAEAEVAEHLEEGEVPVGATHLVEVVVLSAGPDALLDRHRPPVGRGLVTHEVGLEGNHPGVGEQQAGVDGDDTRRRHDGVALLREEVEERDPELVGGHVLQVGGRRARHGRQSTAGRRGSRSRSAHPRSAHPICPPAICPPAIWALSSASRSCMAVRPSETAACTSRRNALAFRPASRSSGVVCLSTVLRIVL